MKSSGVNAKEDVLVFVYNATSNPAELIGDFIAELMPSQPTKCTLCDLTYSLAFKKREWSAYLKSLPVKTDFYLKDRFLRKFKTKGSDVFPAVYWLENEADSKPVLALSAHEINEATTLDELMNLVDRKVSAKLGN